ncbi:MAG: hypothetical protein HGGPFJEG_00621 [Ignavibacteria bacterium]|nr:hypothetical protein [Ignavibacteria bacterium]
MNLYFLGVIRRLFSCLKATAIEIVVRFYLYCSSIFSCLKATAIEIVVHFYLYCSSIFSCLKATAIENITKFYCSSIFSCLKATAIEMKLHSKSNSIAVHFSELVCRINCILLQCSRVNVKFYFFSCLKANAIKNITKFYCSSL